MSDCKCSICGQTGINLPKTGSNNPYYFGDDGSIQAGVAWPNPRFTDNRDETVTDNLTGLMWTNLNLYKKNWFEVLDFVASLNAAKYLGYEDWHMPNVNELESLINTGTSNTYSWLRDTTNGAFLSNSPDPNSVKPVSYWSSTTCAFNVESAWVVGMGRGVIGNIDKSLPLGKEDIRAIIVRDGQSGPYNNCGIWKTGQTIIYYSGDDGSIQAGVAWPNPRFTDNRDETITDNLTGLMWTKSASLSSEKGWEDAIAHINRINEGSGIYGYNDWRLPNRKELRSLVDYSSCRPSLQTGHPFAGVVVGSGTSRMYHDMYWSSTIFGNNAFTVSLGTGSLALGLAYRMVGGFGNNPNKRLTGDTLNVWFVRV